MSQQLEELRTARREAKAEYDNSWRDLQVFLHQHPPARRPFFLNDKCFAPVNFLKGVSPAQRHLESQVASSKARWSALQAQESALEFQLGFKK